MTEEILLLIQYLFFFLPFLAGLVIGKYLENRHYKALHRREAAMRKVPVVTFRTLPGDVIVRDSQLAQGSVVVSADYLKRFLSGFRAIFGGEMHSYSSLLDRGRREALLRMAASAPEADFFLNVRLETSTLAGKRANSIACVEVLAFGTAIYS